VVRITQIRLKQGRTEADAVGMLPSQPYVRYSHGVPMFRIKEAAALLGVSYDTMRRWAEDGRIEQVTDASGRLTVDGAALARFAQERAESAAYPDPDDGVVSAQSVRNRFTGLVTRVVRDTVMAQVEIQAGPHRFVSLMSREAADELELEPGVLAIAAVKSTNVSVEIPRSR
jgi:molybdopterin-binding protein